MLALANPIALHRLVELKGILLWLRRHCLGFCPGDIEEPAYGKLKNKDEIVNIFGAGLVIVVNCFYHF